MKNVKYLGFVGLGCATLLLTGCGGGSSEHTLTCTKSEGDQSQEIVYEFDDKDEKITAAKVKMTAKIPEGTSDEDIEKEKESLNQMLCTSGMFEDCETDVSGNDLVFKASVSKTGLEQDTFSGETKQDVKEKQEQEGYSCK